MLQCYWSRDPLLSLSYETVLCLQLSAYPQGSSGMKLPEVIDFLEEICPHHREMRLHLEASESALPKEPALHTYQHVIKNLST